MGSILNFSLIALAMLAFAGNSLLCRVALKGGAIDAASFTSVRLLSGAITLGALVWLQHKPDAQPQRPTTATLPGDGWSALALFVYAAGFSFAYLSMTAATGALLLFGAVQATMIAWGLYQGERMRKLQLGGFVLAGGPRKLLVFGGVEGDRGGRAQPRAQRAGRDLGCAGHRVIRPVAVPRAARLREWLAEGQRQVRAGRGDDRRVEGARVQIAGAVGRAV